MKYLIKDVIPAYVIFSYEVEANSIDEAKQIYREESGIYLGNDIGDTIDSIEGEIIVEKIEWK